MSLTLPELATGYCLVPSPAFLRDVDLQAAEASLHRRQGALRIRKLALERVPVDGAAIRPGDTGLTHVAGLRTGKGHEERSDDGENHEPKRLQDHFKLRVELRRSLGAGLPQLPEPVVKLRLEVVDRLILLGDLPLVA